MARKNWHVPDQSNTVDAMMIHHLTYNVWFDSCVSLSTPPIALANQIFFELGVDVLPKRSPPDSDLLAVLGDPLFLPILLSHTAASL